MGWIDLKQDKTASTLFKPQYHKQSTLSVRNWLALSFSFASDCFQGVRKKNWSVCKGDILFEYIYQTWTY